MSEIDDFRKELLESVESRLPSEPNPRDREYAFSSEMGERLTQAEEFQDFVPTNIAGTGQRNRKFRVDAYELVEYSDSAKQTGSTGASTDGSMRLVITHFSGQPNPGNMTRSHADKLFGQLSAFIEESISERIFDNHPTGAGEQLELARKIAGKHQSLSRYRFFLITDLLLSDRVKDLPLGEIDGHPVEYHIWDIGRLHAVSTSSLGAEELVIDFTEFSSAGGLPCLKASHGDDYQGYLAVIPGDMLAELYDRYGSKLMEGNVRSFLSARGQINKGIQVTVRDEPEKFFVYNNGISTTATKVSIIDTVAGPRLVSAKYFQIVNGGQTTASLHLALKKGAADLKKIHVQMKLSVVTASDVEKLDDIIESIAKYSNKQNKVSNADFFSNHPYHRKLEKISRDTAAPAAEGAQYETYWFYERARGQHQNAQLLLTPTERRKFLRIYPRAQLITKTDLAKFENSWKQLPQTVSKGAQKNFSVFAEWVTKHWGSAGRKFDNRGYFKHVVSRAILFRTVEKLVSNADWYEGGYRANIVTYTVAKLSCMIDSQKPGCAPDFDYIWRKQALSPALVNQLQIISRDVAREITTPPSSQMNISEWCKKDDCWANVSTIEIPLSPKMIDELLSPEDVNRNEAEAIHDGNDARTAQATIDIFQLGHEYWRSLMEWSEHNCPLSGRERRMVEQATRPTWYPANETSIRLANSIRERMEDEGFRYQ